MYVIPTALPQINSALWLLWSRCISIEIHGSGRFTNKARIPGRRQGGQDRTEPRGPSSALWRDVTGFAKAEASKPNRGGSGLPTPRRARPTSPRVPRCGAAASLLQRIRAPICPPPFIVSQRSSFSEHEMVIFLPEILPNGKQLAAQKRQN